MLTNLHIGAKLALVLSVIMAVGALAHCIATNFADGGAGLMGFITCATTDPTLGAGLAGLGLTAAHAANRAELK